MSLRCKACDRKLLYMDDDLCTQCRRAALSYLPALDEDDEPQLLPSTDALDYLTASDVDAEEKHLWVTIFRDSSD